MKTCSHCGNDMPDSMRKYCSRQCATDVVIARKKDRQRAGTGKSRYDYAREEEERAEEALRILKLEMQTDYGQKVVTPVEARSPAGTWNSTGLAEAEARAAQFGDRGAERALLREQGVTGRARASRQATSPGQTMA